MKKYLTAKQDLEKYSITDLLTLAHYYGIPFKNHNDLCWLLSLNILGHTVRGEMNGKEKWTALKAAVEAELSASETEDEPSGTETEDEPSATETEDEPSATETEDEPSGTETEEEGDIPESWEELLPLKEQCELHNKEFEMCDVNIVHRHRCKHNREAKYLTKRYHDLGDRWWTEDCNAEMTLEQMNDAIKDLELVYKLRCKHSKEFCNSEIDIRHLGALRKIQRKLEHCLKLKCQETGVEISLPDHPAFADIRLRVAKAKVKRRDEEPAIKKREGQTFRASIYEYFQRKRIGKEVYDYVPVGKAWIAMLKLPTGELLSGSMKRSKKDAAEDAAKRAYEFIVSKS
jgi:hypothetical protein